MSREFGMAVLIFHICLLSFFIYQNKTWAMDKFREHHTFEEALIALKNGKCIRRAKMYEDTYIKTEVTIKGKTHVEYGVLRENDRFKSGMILNEKDLMADDWVIEEAN
jgi:hypothetical protein